MTLEELIVRGTKGTQTLQVVDALTVGFTVPGMPMVFATPQMIHHMEVVAAAAIAEFLPSSHVSVGTRVEVEHLAATPVGFEVTTTAIVARVDGPQVTFEVFASDGIDTIGSGMHIRTVIELGRFHGGMQRKQDASSRR